MERMRRSGGTMGSGGTVAVSGSLFAAATAPPGRRASDGLHPLHYHVRGIFTPVAT